MAKKLYVGNISWGVSDEDLKEAFAQFGEITDHVVMKDRDSGRSRGFGFVTFAEDADAEAAIEAMNEYELDGRALTVNEAKPREDRF
jgi:cold-inducible RNA-binding protein